METGRTNRTAVSRRVAKHQQHQVVIFTLVVDDLKESQRIKRDIVPVQLGSFCFRPHAQMNTHGSSHQRLSRTEDEAPRGDQSLSSLLCRYMSFKMLLFTLWQISFPPLFLRLRVTLPLHASPTVSSLICRKSRFKKDKLSCRAA